MKSLLFLLILLLTTTLFASENLFQGKNHDGKSITVNFDKANNKYILQFDSKNPVFFPADDSQKLIDLFVALL